MPSDAMMVSLAVLAVFVAFAAVLFWADKQTSSSDFRSDGSGRKRSGY
jgi:nitrogen fixation-related uncharacterized protein